MKLQIAFVAITIFVVTVTAPALQAQKQSQSTKNLISKYLKNWKAKPVRSYNKNFWEYRTDDTVDWKVSLIGNNPVVSTITTLRSLIFLIKSNIL